MEPVTWCTECGSGLTKDGYCTACLIQEIETLQMSISELNELQRESREIVNAVAHIGIDFGYGPYALEGKYIEAARRLCEADAWS